MTETHTVRIDFEDRESAEKAFDRLDHMDWVMVEGGTLSLSSVADPPDLGRARLLEQIAEASAHHLAGYDGDLVSYPVRDLGDRRNRVEVLLKQAGLYPPSPEVNS